MELEAYAKVRQIYNRDIPGLLRSWLGKAEWARFLDVGCGDGRLLFALHESGLLRGKEVSAVDVSPERVALAGGISPEFRCWVDDACNLAGVPDGSMDFVISTGVISQVPDDGKMVSEIGRVLAPGGTVFISTIRKRWYAWYYYRSRGEWVIDPFQMREYRHRDELLRHFRAEGLEIVACEESGLAFSVLDFILRKAGADHRIFRHRWLEALRIVKVPVPGYRRLLVVARKPAEPGKGR